MDHASLRRHDSDQVRRVRPQGASQAKSATPGDEVIVRDGRAGFKSSCPVANSATCAACDARYDRARLFGSLLPVRVLQDVKPSPEQLPILPAVTPRTTSIVSLTTGLRPDATRIEFVDGQSRQ